MAILFNLRAFARNLLRENRFVTWSYLGFELWTHVLVMCWQIIDQKVKTFPSNGNMKEYFFGDFLLSDF